MNAGQQKDSASKKFKSVVNPPPKELPDKFYRINSLPEQHREDVIKMILDGQSSFNVAGKIQQEWGYHQDMSRYALSALLGKFKAESGDTPLLAIKTENMRPEQKTRHKKAILYCVDCLVKSTELILMRKDKIKEIHEKENCLQCSLAKNTPLIREQGKALRSHTKMLLRLVGKKLIFEDDVHEYCFD